MIKGLVMDERRKETLKALAKAYVRRDKDDKTLSNDMWAADFVKGKGSGLIFLLHGKPGVGKTCTAGRPSFLFMRITGAVLSWESFEVLTTLQNASQRSPDDRSWC